MSSLKLDLVSLPEINCLESLILASILKCSTWEVLSLNKVYPLVVTKEVSSSPYHAWVSLWILQRLQPFDSSQILFVHVAPLRPLDLNKWCQRSLGLAPLDIVRNCPIWAYSKMPFSLQQQRCFAYLNNTSRLLPRKGMRLPTFIAYSSTTHPSMVMRITLVSTR